MPYTGDPANNPLDEVRFLVGDTNLQAEELTDPEVQFLLVDRNGNTLEAAARAAEALASKYSAAVVEKQVGPLRISSGTRGLTKAERYLKLAKHLWQRALARSATPYAGGISVADKNARRADTERVKPTFARDQMRYPLISLGQSAENEKVNNNVPD